jgi:ATP-dependent DNA helicase RecG
VRVIKYKGQDKRVSEKEVEGRKGYAVAFSELMKYITGILPKEETYRGGIRQMTPMYPETALREIIANALIHQDFTISGSGPVIEIYDGRIEITNPGNSLIEIDRIIDERRSRNEKLASTMRGLDLCEERGGGLDKAIIEIEDKNLPPPEFHSSKDSMRVVLHGPKAFSKLSKTEKMRACYFHCVIRWLKNDYMSNTTLRGRFRLSAEEYQSVSNIISASVKAKRIAQAEPNQGKRNAKYVPYWARKSSRRTENA